MKYFATKSLLLIYAVLTITLNTGCDRGESSFTQDVYIWQRVWKQPTVEAIHRIAPAVNRLAVLAVEIEFGEDGPRSVFIEPNYQALQDIKKPIVLCIRIGAWHGPFTKQNPTTDFILKTITTSFQHARESGIEPDELQIDFDCSESDLAGYRDWLKIIREVSGRMKLSITALPSWLNQQEFEDLIQEVDTYTLQVHGLQKTNNSSSNYTLYNLEDAIAWVQKASLLNKSFLVALPTYGYQLIHDDTGKLIDVVAEEPGQFFNKKSQYLMTKPEDMVRLVNSWTKIMPPRMEGIIWYRLPTTEDKLNWPIETLFEVMAGRDPKEAVKSYFRNNAEGLQEVWLENIGNTMVSQYQITINGDISKILAAEVSSGQIIHDEKNSLVFTSKQNNPIWLKPGGEFKVGWLRLVNNETFFTLTTQ